MKVIRYIKERYFMMLLLFGFIYVRLHGAWNSKINIILQCTKLAMNGP